MWHTKIWGENTQAGCYATPAACTNVGPES